MSQVRRRRLIADHEQLRRLLTNHPYVRLAEAEGDPPERYRIEYRVRGLAVQNGRVVAKSGHLVEVFLTLAYPRQGPQCRMLTPVFHPNIAPHAICIGDHWSAGESLAHLLLRIGEMITYQSYNLKSPLNKEAARWADENLPRLPIQKVDLFAQAGEVRPDAVPPPPAADGMAVPAAE